MTISADDYIHLPLSLAIDGPTSGFCQVIAKHWWAVTPDKGLRFYNPVNQRTGKRRRKWGSPQCNSNKLVITRLALADTDYVEYFERVFVPIDIDEYRE